MQKELRIELNLVKLQSELSHIPLDNSSMKSKPRITVKFSTAKFYRYFGMSQPLYCECFYYLLGYKV